MITRTEIEKIFNIYCENTGSYRSWEPEQQIIIHLLAQIDALRSYMEIIDTERYPPQVFLRMTDTQWHSLKLWCDNEGFPIDRLSGNYGRILRKSDMLIAREALAQTEHLKR